MFLDPRSNTCPLAALWNTLGHRCSDYVVADLYNGLYQACTNEANKKDGTCPKEYMRYGIAYIDGPEKEASNESDQKMD